MGPLSGLLAVGMVALCCRGGRGPMLRRMVLQHGRSRRPRAIAPQGLTVGAPSLGAVAQPGRGGAAVAFCALAVGRGAGGCGVSRRGPAPLQLGAVAQGTQGECSHAPAQTLWSCAQHFAKLGNLA